MNYRETLNLPKTDFPMRANLPQREPEILKRWGEQDIYGRIMKRPGKTRAKYIIHDGPPYSNGDIHMGHALNKVLKDMIIKFNTMTGYQAPYVPGWDCHGLPVEHQLMKNLNIEKGDIPQIKFRAKARNFALKYVKVQKAQFQRLGVFGDWEKPYLTLDTKYESAIVRSFAKLVGLGYIYKGLKPVNWCYKCETALAEAEVEYENCASPSVFVKFKLADSDKFKTIIKKSGIKEDIHVLIWTTTPWTLVANTAIALSPSMKYALIKDKGEYLILAKELLSAVGQKAGFTAKDTSAEVYGRELEGLDCLHPFIERKSKIVLAEYVSREEGTGCVHTAPGHGQEDYITGKKYNLPTLMPVDSKGRFDETAGEFKNMHVFKANEKIVDVLKQKNALVYTEAIRHSYPHCWRCKNPIIFRATAQYFMDVDHNNLRKKAANAITDNVKWMPDSGKARIFSMVENRPDWCLSRQRLWGVPITAFYCSECDELLLDEKLINHAADIFEREGANAWFTKEAEELLPEGVRCNKCGNDRFRKESDILDVWFESGISHQAVLKPRREFPADLYLEGSDQHRGWFQSSLICSMAIDGRPPYRAVLTHGFVVDGTGKKMSKSFGNVISPEDVMKKYGADILRIWVASCDYSDDMRISEEILARLAEAYRKIRNTCRYILGNLNDFDPNKDSIPPDKWPEIDKWALWRACGLLESVEKNFKNFVFHKAFSSIYNFCVVDMSSVYLDVLKDILYTAGKDSAVRRSAQSALFEIITILTRVMAPILVYTSEEVWQSLGGIREKKSIHLEEWPKLNELKTKIALSFQKTDVKRWSEKLLPLRSAVLKELEQVRGKNVIGSSLDAKVILHSDSKEWQSALEESRHMMKSLLIVSSVEIAGDLPEQSVRAGDIPIGIKIAKAEGRKCERCWNYSTSVGNSAEYSGLCSRCECVIKSILKSKKGR